MRDSAGQRSGASRPVVMRASVLTGGLSAFRCDFWSHRETRQAGTRSGATPMRQSGTVACTLDRKQRSLYGKVFAGRMHRTRAFHAVDGICRAGLQAGAFPEACVRVDKADCMESGVS